VIFEKPFEVLLVNAERTVLVDPVLCGMGSPSTAPDGSGIVWMDRHHGGSMEDNRHTSTGEDFRTGIVADFAATGGSLTLDHLHCVNVIHSALTKKG